MTLTEFLLARIAEDEESGLEIFRVGRTAWAERVLAECEAKRRIVERYLSSGSRAGRGNPAIDALYVAEGEAIIDLAAVYADHPDYREEWRS